MPTNTGRLRRTEVAAKEWITPHLLRVSVQGDLEDFTDHGTDQHIALYFYPPEAMVPIDLRADTLRELHEFAFPQVRRYTIRRWDAARREIDIDFVVHEPAGIASSWARDARIGDPLIWWGPTPAWPAPTSGALVMVGDESALPAIDATLAQLDRRVHARVIVEIADASDEVYLAHHRDRHDITWVHRGRPRGDLGEDLVGAVTSLRRGEESVAVWGGTEFRTAGFLRRRFIGEWGLTKSEAFIVSYWIHGQSQDQRIDERHRDRNLANRAEHPDRAARFLAAGIPASPHGVKYAPGVVPKC